MSPPNPKANSESKAKLANAIQWLQENPGEKATTASRIFDVLPQTIRMAIASTKRKEVARKAIVRGGQNRILSNSQEEAIQSYCKDQYEAGLGATKQMVFAAISFLKG
jgi:transposase